MIIEFFTNLNQSLISIIQTYGIWIYPLLFFLIFGETGFIIIPFIPGDSLLFTAGTLASAGSISIILLFLITAFAAIIGDSVNYWIGSFIGKKADEKKWIKEKYLLQTKEFYKKYGGKTIIIARFIPVIRTFAPFIAGVGRMKYSKFLLYNIIGGILWTALFVFAGFFFGNFPFVKNNLSLVIILIIIVSVIPVVIELIKHRFAKV